MNTVFEIAGDKDNVAVFASGPSLLRMGIEEVREVKTHCLTVFMNYAMSRFGPDEMDILAWGDWKVSQWISLRDSQDGIMFWTTESAFQFGEPSSVLGRVSAWIVSSRGNFTMTNVLHDLTTMLPGRKILLFGVDMMVEKDVQKWYDSYTDADSRGRNMGANHDRCFEAQRRELALVNGGNVWNCNLGSRLDVFKKSDWRKVVEL